MAAVIPSMLLIGLLVSIFEESFQARGWTEVRNVQHPLYHGLAVFAYLDQRQHDGDGYSFLVTQARWKEDNRTARMYQIGFIVFLEEALHEKCIAIVTVRPVYALGRRRTVHRFWCRPVA
ncbi:hypothetical protein MTO96_029103 [Rhipicephalus appendiculatus]